MTTPIADDFIGQRQRRIEKVEELKKLGIDPYPAHSVKEYSNKEITEQFSNFENKVITLSGRLVSWRDHGKLIFANLQDQSGKIQLWLKNDELQGDLKKGFLPWENLNLVDVGDFIEAHGNVTKTVRGEITLLVKNIRMLSKSIRLLPTKLAHKEQMFRRRYLDLTINPEQKELFLRKAKFWKVQREYMEKNGFIEVEVPVLEHVTGGADARPFVTLHNELNQEFYMRISTELYQKRLIGGGFEKIFTVGPNFRNEGLSDEHLQEYYQIEWYWGYADYRDNMELVKNMMRHTAKEVYGTTKFSTRGHEFDLADDWKEIDYVKTIKEHHGIDIFEDSDEKMKAALEKAGVDLPGAINRNRLIDNLWKVIRKTLAGPAFLVNEPKFMSPLAKSKPEDERLTERFHVVLGGSELGNGYSEINDPQDQLERFLDQQKMRNQGDDEAQMLDIDYVEMLEYGMPPTSGYAHSERLFWFLEDVTAREGTLFPQLRHEVEALTKEIYAEKLKPYNIQLEKSPLVAGKPPATNTVKEVKVAKPINMKDGITRDQAFEIVNSNIANKNLVKHCISVEGAMEALAEHFGESKDAWGMAGLLHDADWEKTADDVTQHTLHTVKWIEAAGDVDPAIKRAILAHNFATNPEPAPQSNMEWSLACCDELTGLITAACLILPDKKLSSLKISSILKRFKTPSFAAAVNRDDISRCEEKLGIPLEQFVEIVLKGMITKADLLGL